MPNLPGIDRRSPMPFYSQLKQFIVADIRDRGLEPGERLPGEHELCELFGVSRTVVRQALAELEHEGVVWREKGRGTFVGDPRTSRGIGGALIGSFEDIQSKAGEQHSRVLSRRVVAAGGPVAHDLRVAIGDEIVEIERVREVDGVPWAFTRTQLPADIGRPLLDAELEDVSLFALMDSLGIRVERAHRSIEADVATDSVASILGTATGSPLLVMRSVSFDVFGRPIERFTGFHRGDRSRLDIEVTRRAAGVDIL